ncbi:MAG: hypothetical protein AAB363_02605, partial [Planctomycetota bacterium]
MAVFLAALRFFAIECYLLSGQNPTRSLHSVNENFPAATVKNAVGPVLARSARDALMDPKRFTPRHGTPRTTLRRSGIGERFARGYGTSGDASILHRGPRRGTERRSPFASPVAAPVGCRMDRTFAKTLKTAGKTARR